MLLGNGKGIPAVATSMLMLALLGTITNTVTNLFAVVALDFNTIGVLVTLGLAVFGNVAQL
jgi:hypothetical protein